MKKHRLKANEGVGGTILSFLTRRRVGKAGEPPALPQAGLSKFSLVASGLVIFQLLASVPAMAVSDPMRNSYTQEKKIQQQPAQVGPQPVTVHKDEQEPAPYQSPDDAKQEHLLPLSQPSFKALISVDRRLDPFGLEASFSEEIGLRDVLKMAIGSNLDILNIKAGERAQRYSYLSALSKFLPDAVMGYNLYYVDGVIKMPGGFGGGPSSSVVTSKISSPFTLVNGGLRYKAYQGGAVLFGAIQNKHEWKAARAQVTGNINDVLLTAAKRYYDLLRQEALLHIRIKAVETSGEQVRQNSSLEASGLATNLDILQARTQLARDRQNLVEQQSARRNAAILLAQTLNINLGQDLIPSDKVVGKAHLINKKLQIADLLKLAVDNRPELKQYEEQRLAAKAQIMSALAPLHPNVTFTTAAYGVGPQLSNMGALLNLGLGVNWTLGGLGATDTLNAQAAKMRSRQALIQANQKFLQVFTEVRSAYVNMLSSEQRIEEATDEVNSAREELRLSRLRLDNGLGTNLDVLTAQRDVTQAYIDKVEAIINFNVAQVQLLHDVGLISVDTLSSGMPAS
jgi:OMF family outer membrane factor